MPEKFDYIVVGAGSAGCVLAARLSERTNVTVLLLEAGRDVPPDKVPTDIADKFPHSSLNPSYFWEGLQATIRAGEAPRNYPQARVLGGGSSINGMVAVRGLPADYDRWSRAGAAGWAWKDVEPWFDKIERDVDDDKDGSVGAVPVDRVPDTLWPAYVRALKDEASAHGFPFLKNVNRDARDGFFAMPLNVTATGRATSSSCYLSANVRQRSNLRIVTGATVETLTFEGTAVSGVTVKSKGERLWFGASKIVVAAGAIHSPALLLRSGIGPADALQHLGIEIVCDRPGVGANLQNHPYMFYALTLPKRTRMRQTMRSFVVAGLRASSKQHGTGNGDIFIFSTGRVSPSPVGTSFGMVGVALYEPFSRGSVTLTSKDPAAYPKIDFRMLEDDRDASRLVTGARLAERLLLSAAVKTSYNEAFLLPPMQALHQFSKPGAAGALYSLGMKVLFYAPPRVRELALSSKVGRSGILKSGASPSDEAILSCVAAQGHPVGTCAIGRGDNPSAVVGPDCSVFGIKGLYIADASVMPTIPSANTNLSTVMIAERVAHWLNTSSPDGR